MDYLLVPVVLFRLGEAPLFSLIIHMRGVFAVPHKKLFALAFFRSLSLLLNHLSYYNMSTSQLLPLG